VNKKRSKHPKVKSNTPTSSHFSLLLRLPFDYHRAALSFGLADRQGRSRRGWKWGEGKRELVRGSSKRERPSFILF